MKVNLGILSLRRASSPEPPELEPGKYSKVSDTLPDGSPVGYVEELAPLVQAMLKRDGWEDTGHTTAKDVEVDDYVELVSALATPQRRSAASQAHAEAATDAGIILQLELAGYRLRSRGRKIAAGVLRLPNRL